MTAQLPLIKIEWTDLTEAKRAEVVTAFVEALPRITCVVCDGKGTRYQQHIDVVGIIGQGVVPEPSVEKCIACHGSGKVSRDPRETTEQAEAVLKIVEHFPLYI